MKKTSWSDGTTVERSIRILEKEHCNLKEVNNHALTTSLFHNEDTWELLNQTIYSNSIVSKTKTKTIPLDKNQDKQFRQMMGYNPS